MNNTIMDKINGRPYGLRILYAALGLFIFAFGVYLTIQANVGLAPWDAFSMGVSYHVPLTYGDIVTLTGFVILAIDLLLKEKIGLGSILDVCIVGKSVDLFTWLDIVPQLHNIWIGIPVLLAGLAIEAFAMGIYMAQGLSCGPRDALLVAMGKRLKKFPIGAVKMIIDGFAVAIGFILEAKVGIGTVVAVFGMGFILQGAFKVMKFDATAVTHENIIGTVNRLKRINENTR